MPTNTTTAEKKRSRREILELLVGEKFMPKMRLVRTGEKIGVDSFGYAYFFIEGDLDHAAFERIMRSVRRCKHNPKFVYVLATGFELFQSRTVRFNRLSSVLRGGWIN